VKIRDAAERHLLGMVDLWWDMQSSHYDYNERFYQTKSEKECRKLAREYFKKLLHDKNHLVLVAEELRRTVGLIHVELLAMPPVYTIERYAIIREAVITKSSRRLGIFKALFNHVEERLKSNNINLINLFVDINNPATKAYEQLGFTTRQKLMTKWI